ncbi:MAG: gluconate 2-dehydrogenase subunit 3 family protein [Bryobacteraceae bacterium]|jgi:gluconate 2-dehydrogenase gamma chain
MGSKTLRRRRFLQIAATAAASGAVSCSRQEASPWRFFTAEEGRTINAIAARIIPADQDAGAAQAGAANYIDRHLTGIFKKHRKAYRQGIIGVNHVSEAMFGQRFAALAAGQQDAVLVALEAGSSDAQVWQPAQGHAFFELVCDHTMQGFYGDPRHGGNREYASWRMLGVPVAPIRGRQRYDLTTGLAEEDRRNRPWR